MSTGRETLARRANGRRRVGAVESLRRLAGRGEAGAAPGPGGRPTAGPERCDLCDTELAEHHRHLLKLTERAILCACESCVALRSGDAELRPVGNRVSVLDEFRLSDEDWAALSIPIGLCFFLRSSTAGRTVAFYPSPAGATECELDLDAWDRLCEANPELHGLETDVEAFVVDRISAHRRYAIVPIDECYRLVGMIKVGWKGISGGEGPAEAATAFFESLRARGAG